MGMLFDTLILNPDNIHFISNKENPLSCNSRVAFWSSFMLLFII